MCFCLCGAAQADSGYEMPPAWNAVGRMWAFMDEFLGYGGSGYRYPGYGWSGPSSALAGQPLDGLWRALSGEYWLVQGERFTLYAGPYRQYSGLFRLEGRFLRAQMPWGVTEFSYRQWDDVLLLRDVSGQVMPLYRVRRNGWRW
jgi:hypothetical protein